MPEGNVCLRESRDGVIFAVYAVPKSSRTEFVDIHLDRCRIKVKAPPVDGEANKVLVAAIARAFGLTKKMVKLESGQKGKQKSFCLHGIDIKQAEKILDKILSDRKGQKKL